MKKRSISLLLCLTMVFSLLPGLSPRAAAADTAKGKEIDQSTYDAMGLTLDADAAAKELTAPYSTTQTTQAFSAREVYVAANGASGNRYTLRDGFDRMETRNADISDGSGNLDGAYGFYGISSGDINLENGNSLGSKLSSNRGGNVLANTNNEFSGIYATSVAFNGGEGKDNYVAELRAYGNNQTTGSKKGKIEVAVFKIHDNGYRERVSTLNPILTNQSYGDVLSYMTRRYVQELDALFEIKALDRDGDGKDELYVYCGSYYDTVDGSRMVEIDEFQGSGGGRFSQNRIALSAGNANSYNTDGSWEHHIEKHPVVTMAGGDLNRDGKEELAVAVSAPTYNSNVASVARLTVFEGSNAALPTAINGLKDVPLVAPDGEKAMVSANCAFGEFALPNTSITGTVLLVGGYQSNGKTSEPGTGAYNTGAYRYIYYNPLTKRYQVSDYMTQALGSKSMKIADSYSLKEGHYRPTHAPLPLACADTEGIGAGNNDDEVLFGGEVYNFNATSGLTSEIGSISLCTSQVNSNDNNKDKEQVWIGDVAVGSVDANPSADGKKWRESFICVVGTHRAEKVNGSDDYYWMDVAAFWKEGTYYHSTQEGVVAESNRRNDTYGTFISLSLPDIGNDSVSMRYVNQYTVYTDPEVYAVLQASPYFADLAERYDYIGNGGTAYGVSSSAGNTKGGSFSQSVGVYHSLEVQALAGGEYEVELAGSYSYDYAECTSVEHSISYNDQAGGGDQVVVYTVPYVYYVYEMYDPVSRQWSTTIMPAALDPVTAVMNVEDYDDLAAKTQGLDPIANNILYSTPGAPETYVNQPAGERQHTYNGTYASITSSGSGSDITQEISVTKETEKTHTLEATLNVKVGGGGAFLGNKGYVGITSSTSAGGSFGTTSSSGTTFSGTVDGLPKEGSQYGFNWKLIVNSANLNGNPVWVVGYDVKNVSQPPKMPQNLTVTQVGTHSIDLQWDNSGNAAYYEVSMVDRIGNYNKIATLPYTVTSYQAKDLMANTTYNFSVRAVSATKGSSIDSPTVTATTMNDGALFEIVEQPKDSNAAAGQPVIFKARANFTDKDGQSQPVGYEWQYKTPEIKSTWQKVAINHAQGISTPELTVTPTNDMDDYQYRCRVYYRDYTLYTMSALLDVSKSDSKITINGLQPNAILSAEGDIVTTADKIITERKAVSLVTGTGAEQKAYTLLKNDAGVFLWFDGANYYSYTGAALTLDTDKEVAKDISFTAGNIGGLKTVTKSDYTATINTVGADGQIARSEAALTSVGAVSSPNLVYDGKTYTPSEKWTSADTGYAKYAFYKASAGSGSTLENAYLYTADATAGVPVYQPFSLGWANKIGDSKVSDLSTTFQKTETHTTVQNRDPVVGKAVTLTAAPVAKDGGEPLTGDVSFVISGAGGETVPAVKQPDNTYEAQWTPKYEGKLNVMAVFAGNSTYYASNSEPVSVYAVMQPTEARTTLDLAAPVNVTYGTSAALAATEITSGTPGATVDVTKLATYTVQKLVTTKGAGGVITSNYVAAVENADYTLVGGIFTPKTVTNYQITAEKDGRSDSKIIVVNKGTLVLAATNTVKSVNDTDRKPLDATVSGAAEWDAPALQRGVDYMLSTDGALSGAEIGEYPITVSLVDTDQNANTVTYTPAVQALAEKYNITLQKAVYQLNNESYQVNLSAGVNGGIGMTCQSPGSTVDISVQSGDSLPAGSKVTVTAMPTVGYVVSGWKVNGNYVLDGENKRTGTTYSIDKLSQKTNVSVEFAASTNVLSYAAADANGTVTGNYLNDTGLGETIASGNNVNYQQTIRLTATPKDGYSIDHWTVKKGLNGTTETLLAADGKTNFSGSTYDFSKFTDDMTVTVYFVADTKPVITIKPVGNDGNPLNGTTKAVINGQNLTMDGNGQYTYQGKIGDNLTISFTPPDGLLVQEWQVKNGQTIGALSNSNRTMTLYNLKANTDFTVVCTALNRYPVTFEGKRAEEGEPFAEEAGTVTALKADVGTITSGAAQLQSSTIVVTAKAKTGYEITKWEENGAVITADVQNDGSQKMQIPALSMAEDIKVTFRKLGSTQIAYSVVDSNGAQEGGTFGTIKGAASRQNLADYDDADAAGLVSGGGKTVYENGKLNLEATPATGYRVKEWQVNGQSYQLDGRTFVGSKLELEYAQLAAMANKTITVQFEKGDAQITFQDPAHGTLAAKVGEAVFTSGGSSKQEVVFTVTPETHYVVKEWQVNGKAVAGQTAATFTYQPAAGQNAAIAVLLQGEELDLLAKAEAGGTVSGLPQIVRYKDSVTLTAAASTGYTFEGWYFGNTKIEGASAVYSFSAEASGAYTAKFTPTADNAVQYQLSDSKMGTLTASENGVAFASGKKFIGGAQVKLVAAPAEGHRITGWAGLPANAQISADLTTVTATVPQGGLNITANLEKIPTRTITIAATTHGHITAQVDGKDVTAVPDGTVVTFTAMADPNWMLKQWKGDLAAQKKATFTMAVTSDLTADAEFMDAVNYTVHYSVVGTGGSASGIGAGKPIAIDTDSQCVGGSQLTFTALPDANHMVKEWKINKEVQKNLSNTLVIESLGRDTTVTVEFETPEKLHALPADTADYTLGSIVKTPSDYGAERQIRDRGDVSFVVTPAKNKTITALVSSAGTVKRNTDGTWAVTAKNVLADITLQATVKEGVPLTIESGANGKITVMRGKEELKNGDAVKAGDALLITAAANASYLVQKVTVNGAAFSNGKTYTVTEKDQAVVVAATFYLGGGGGGMLPSVYAVTVAKTANGTAAADKDNALAGQTVTVTVKADHGYQLKNLIVTDDKGSEIKTEANKLEYRFTMPASDVVIKTEFVRGGTDCPSAPYEDLDITQWYHEGVDYAIEKGLMKGTGEHIFSPNTLTTRGMIVAILYRLEGQPEAETARFGDVPADTYYAGAIGWAAANGVVKGYGNGDFGPDDSITREQMVAILHRYAVFKGKDVSKKAELSAFTDAETISAYARESMQWAYQEGLVSGVTNTELAPTAGATRAQVATLLMRFCKNLLKV
ncbi:InlB B-repeat-containing protein [Acidaminobacterium chupaoyuni]